MYIKRLLAFLLSFVLVFTTTTAFAASPAGWTATAADAAMSGAAVTIKAFKGNGANAVKSVISYAPTAGKIAKEIAKGGGFLAVAYAMSKLLDAGIDWVLDPENNRVKYTIPAQTGVDVAKHTFKVQGAGVATTAAEGCELYAASTGGTVVSVGSPSDVSTNTYDGIAYRYDCVIKNQYGSNSTVPGYMYGQKVIGDIEEQEKYIPLTTVADQIISDAAAGAAAPAEFVKAVAVGAANAGELDAALDAAAESTTETQTPDPAKPAEPTKPFDDSGILAALKAILAALGLLSLLGTISDSITSFVDWFKTEPEKDKDGDALDIPPVIPPIVDSSLSFGGSCPPDMGFTMNIFGNSVEFIMMPFSKFCPLLDTYIKPVLIVLGSFMAVTIVGGRRDV